jgi:cytochrome P450
MVAVWPRWVGMSRSGRSRPMEFTPERFLEGGNSVGVDMTGTKGIRIMPFGVGRMICAGLSIARVLGGQHGEGVE